MKDKRLATLALSSKELDRTPQEVIEVLLRLLSRVEDLESRRTVQAWLLAATFFAAKSVMPCGQKRKCYGQ